MSRENGKSQVRLSLSDHAINGFQAGLIAIPGIGSALEKLLFGAASEMRFKRIERILEEIADKVDDEHLSESLAENEDFANHFESIIPDASKATNENKRRRFRDLILNMMSLRDGHPRWCEAAIAIEILKKLGDLDMLILSSMHKCISIDQSNNTCCIVRAERKFVMGIQKGRHDFSLNDSIIDHSHKIEFVYESLVIRHSLDRLADFELIEWPKNKGDFIDLNLAPLGEFLLDWVISDRFDDNFSDEHCPKGEKS